MPLELVTTPAIYGVRYLGRPLTCTRCGLVWDVIDFPVGHIDPVIYVCPDHLLPVTIARQFGITSGFATSNEAEEPEANETAEYSPGEVRHLRVVA